MKTIRQHWIMTSSLAALLMLAAGFWWYQTGASTVSAFPPENPLSAVQRSAIETVLCDMALDREALISLNPSSEQAESILSTVREWYLSNASTLATLKAAIDSRVHDVRQVEQSIALGPYNAEHAQTLATARQDLASAQASYRNALSSLIEDVNEVLSVSQRTTWAAIPAGFGQEMPLRMLSLSDQQRMSLSAARRRLERQRAAAGDSSEREAAHSAWQTALGQILTQDQQNVLSAYASNYATASGAVAAALASELSSG